MRTPIFAAAALLVLAVSPAAAEETPVTPSPTPSAAQGVEIPDFATRAWIVVDADSGDVLAGQNIDEQRPMASTLKTLTALTLLPRLQYDSTYEGNAHETLTEGMHVGVLAGSSYRVSQLFHGMLMRSGNDAAVALADSYGYQRTLDAMNAEAQRIGATHTVAKSPNGLDQPGQVTTAADLAQIYRVAIQDPRLQEILTAREFEFPAQPPTDPKLAATTFTIFNHDNLLNSDYPGVLGGKSGFTSQAGRTYVAGAERDGRKLVVALLGIGGGTTATARRLLDWSFANVGLLSPIGQLPEIPDAEDVAPEAAGSHPDDIAPLPPDPMLVEQAQVVGEQAIAATAQATQATQSAVTAVPAAATLSGVGGSVTLGGFAGSPFVAPAPAEQLPAGRGFLGTLLVGLFKALMWILLFLGIAVVLLRIRAVRRQKRRRAAYEEATRQRAARSREPEPTPRRVPSRTG